MEETTRRITRHQHLCWLRLPIRLHPVIGCRAIIGEIHGRDRASNNETSAFVLIRFAFRLHLVMGCRAVIEESCLKAWLVKGFVG